MKENNENEKLRKEEAPTAIESLRERFGEPPYPAAAIWTASIGRQTSYAVLELAARLDEGGCSSWGEWEAVGSSMEAMDVPGGWLVKPFGEEMAGPMVFVPQPTDSQHPCDCGDPGSFHEQRGPGGPELDCEDCHGTGRRNAIVSKEELTKWRLATRHPWQSRGRRSVWQSRVVSLIDEIKRLTEVQESSEGSVDD